MKIWFLISLTIYSVREILDYENIHFIMVLYSKTPRGTHIPYKVTCAYVYIIYMYVHTYIKTHIFYITEWVTRYYAGFPFKNVKMWRHSFKNIRQKFLAKNVNILNNNNNTSRKGILRSWRGNKRGKRRSRQNNDRLALGLIGRDVQWTCGGGTVIPQY